MVKGLGRFAMKSHNITRRQFINAASTAAILRDVPVAESDELQEGIILDYDKEGRIVSLELLDASEYVTEPVSVAYELKGASR
jgi:uncharacterized protein YuzE